MTLAMARIENVADASDGGDVMFNPVSLKVTVGNKVQGDEAGGGGKSDPKQSPQASTAKLDTELIFDTTEEGHDVRAISGPITGLAIVPKTDKIENPKTVRFTWGRFTFQGVLENVTTTYDFWSSDGVPLRATVQITIISLDGIGSRRPLGKDFVKISYGSVPPNGAQATALATRCGDANAGRLLAAANGLESMRMGAGGAAGATLAVAGGIQLKAAAGFSAGAGIGIGISAGAGIGASAGAGAGFGIGASAGAGAGIGAGAGFGASAGAGFSAGAGAGFGASASAGAFAGAGASAGSFAGASFGAGASAGVSASGGAFAGLGVSKSTTLSASLDPRKLLGDAVVTSVGSGAQFDVTGRLIAGGSTGLSANYGGNGVTAFAGVQIL